MRRDPCYKYILPHPHTPRNPASPVVGFDIPLNVLKNVLNRSIDCTLILEDRNLSTIDQVVRMMIRTFVNINCDYYLSCLYNT